MESDIEILKWILEKYNREKARKKRLDARRERLVEEHNNPIHGTQYSPLPRSNKVGDGAAGILFRIAEVEDRIVEQQAAVEKAVIQVMDILDYLPEASTERDIFELRYEDSLEWEDISKEVHLSRSQCHRRHRAALESMLQNKRITKIIEEARPAYERARLLGEIDDEEPEEI